MKLLFQIGSILLAIISTADAQVLCGGSWTLNTPFNQQCISGQHIGSLNPGIDPLGCPVNPVYTINQTNTYTFPIPVSGFTIDFKEFNSSPGCARIEVKINGVFFPLTGANTTFFSHSSDPPCRLPSQNFIVTSDGYITSNGSGGLGIESFGGIIFRNINATTVSISTNDAGGTLFSDPYNCNPAVTFCSGSWALQRPLTVACMSGQWVGWQNPGPPPVGCPTNPIYPGTETNTFTFTNAVSNFSIDFHGFDGQNLCPRIQLKVNGIFYPLTAGNLSDLPSPECTGTSVMTVTPDGYIVSDSPIGSGEGRLTVNGVNATSVSVCTNDGAGTLFSTPFTCMGVVPLTLESFTGNNTTGCKTILNWKTGTELNIGNIEVQQSKDGILFNKVGEVNPKGSNSKYSFVTANHNDFYYRLQINDVDGNYEYSNILSIRSNCNNSTYQIRPNPAQSFIEVIGLDQNDRVLVLDMRGRKVLTFNRPQNNNQLDIRNFNPGTYVLQIMNGVVRKRNLKLIKN